MGANPVLVPPNPHHKDSQRVDELSTTTRRVSQVHDTSPTCTPLRARFARSMCCAGRLPYQTTSTHTAYRWNDDRRPTTPSASSRGASFRSELFPAGFEHTDTTKKAPAWRRLAAKLLRRARVRIRTLLTANRGFAVFSRYRADSTYRRKTAPSAGASEGQCVGGKSLDESW